MPNKKIKKCGNYGPLLNFFATALLHRYFWYKTGHLKTCRPFLALFRRKTGHLRMCKPFFCFPIRATLTIVVVEDIERDPFNHPAREELRLPRYGPPTKKVAHPWSKSCFISICNQWRVAKMTQQWSRRSCSEAAWDFLRFSTNFSTLRLRRPICNKTRDQVLLLLTAQMAEW